MSGGVVKVPRKYLALRIYLLRCIFRPIRNQFMAHSRASMLLNLDINMKVKLYYSARLCKLTFLCNFQVHRIVVIGGWIDNDAVWFRLVSVLGSG